MYRISAELLNSTIARLEENVDGAVVDQDPVILQLRSVRDSNGKKPKYADLRIAFVHNLQVPAPPPDLTPKQLAKYPTAGTIGYRFLEDGTIRAAACYTSPREPAYNHRVAREIITNRICYAKDKNIQHVLNLPPLASKPTDALEWKMFEANLAQKFGLIY